MSHHYKATAERKSKVWIGDIREILPQVTADKSATFTVADGTVLERHSWIMEHLSLLKSRYVTLQQVSDDEKSYSMSASIFNTLIAAQFPKSGYLIGIGGGVVCDIAGFVAMTYRRGIPLLLIPTTLVAQIDAAVGGKNGLNVSNHKNIIGGFHYPEITIVDTRFLNSLGTMEIICGLAEMIKVLVVSDAEALHLLLGELGSTIQLPASIELLVSSAISNKIRLLQSDPFEESSRRLLNFGHAFAHELEEFTNFKMPHGIAVLIGMVMEIALSKLLLLGHLDYLDRLSNPIIKLFRTSGVPFPANFDQLAEVISKTRSARRGSVNWVCPTEPGTAVIVHDAEESIVQRAWFDTMRRMS